MIQVSGVSSSLLPPLPSPTRLPALRLLAVASLRGGPKVLAEINRLRAEHGKPPLDDPELVEACRAYPGADPTPVDCTSFGWRL